MASRSLGTLTLDLIAKIGGFTGPLDKAGRATGKWSRQAQKDAKAIGVAFGALAAGTATALTALTIATVKSAGEISRFASLAGTSTEEFQRYAAGAKAVGVEQDKLADIFKDTSDKVGDFLQTGGGPLADFFENIAPKVGVTADAFRKLSGPQALELYVSSLEKAGASQNEFTFFMEAIASDATLLLPLLKNNAEGFRQLGDSAAAAGAIMDEETIRAANEMAAATLLAEQAMDGINNQIMKALLPTLSDLSGQLLDVSTNTVIAEEAGKTFAAILKGVAATAFGAYSAFQLVGKSIGALVAAFDAAGVTSTDLLLGPLGVGAKVAQNFDEFKSALDIGFEDIGQSVEQYADVLDGIWEAGTDGEGAARQRVKAIADLLEESRKASTSAGTGFSKAEKEKEDAARKAAEAIRDQIAAIELQAETVGLAADEATIYKLALDGATESQLAQARAALATVAAFEEQREAQDAYKQLVSDLRTEEEQLTEQVRERLKVLEAVKGLTDAQRADAQSRIAAGAFEDAPEFGGLAPEVGGAFGELNKIDDAQAKLEDWYATQLEMLDGFRAERADLDAAWDEQELALKQEHETALAGIEQARQMAQLSAAQSTFGELAELTKTFAGEQSGIYKVMFAAQKGFAIAQSLISIQQGIAQAAANPFPANLAAMATVAAATASIIGNIQAVGMAHDGIDSVPQDGTWLLQKGERVTTADTSAKLDQTLANIQAGQRGGMGGKPVQVTVNMPGITNAREARQASGSVQRAIAQGVGAAARFT